MEQPRSALWSRPQRKLVATAFTAGLIAASLSSAAHADVAYFNPFDVNEGFTMLAHGDAHLNNAELEGSIAVFGALSSGKDNYAVVHQAAGRAD